jgi:hypothetical protein
MPSIPDVLLGSVIYLYQSTDRAPKGGSGFITSVEEGGYTHLYAVTNRHIVDQGYTVVQFLANRIKPIILDYEQSDWVFHPSGADLAVCAFDQSGIEAPVVPIPRGCYISANDDLQRLSIGIGDDVFMIGRFLPTEHESISNPVMRFGNISLWPSRRITHPRTGLPEESFMVEMRSQSGFSGSPVFVCVEAGSMRPMRPPVPKSFLPYFKPIFQTVGFLGVDWGHLPESKPQKQAQGAETSESLTSMALVVPDNKLIELLDSPPLVEQRAAVRATRRPPTAICD